MHKEHHGFLYGGVAALAAASMALFAKLAAPVPVETIIFVRFFLGLPFFLLSLFSKKVSFSFGQIPKYLLRSLMGLAALYCYFYAVKILPLVNAVTLANTIPLFMPFVALIWLKLVVSKMRFFALAVGFIGVLILLRPTNAIVEWGSILGLGCGIFGAVALMGVRLLSKTESAETILVYYFIICTFVTLFPAIATWKPIPDVTHWFYLLLISLFATIYQYTLTRAFIHAPATKVSTMNYLGVVFGGLFGWWVFGEVPDYWVWIGTVLIIASALLALFDKTPPRHIGKSRS